ncbi:MAG: apolipoprotein N-acyltransferase [Alphaproteobacteria bacterium]|nr:apolipoprotein N-acyltransferase [Alphaproteobacteria bacterium]
MADLQDKITKTPSWACLLLSFLAGSLSSCAMAPASFFPALFAGLSILYILLVHGTPAKGFILGWLFGFGYFLFSLSWVGNALLVEGNPYAWAWPLAVAGLPLLLAFFPAFACFFARRFSDLKTASGFFAFGAWVVFFEWARGHAFTGFPWNLYGYTWAEHLPVLQILSLTDVYFLTLLTVLWAAAAGFLYSANTTPGAKACLTVFLIALFAGNYAFGYLRLSQTQISYHENIDILLVQANIPQSEKWKAEKIREHFEKRIALSSPHAIAKKTTYIIWPETAISHWLMQDPQTMKEISNMLGLYDSPAYLFTGLLRYEPASDSYHNSLVMIDRQQQVSNVYDKHHLVPFGEYIPFQKWIPLEPVARFKGFADNRRSAETFMTPEKIGYSPIICYEIIFPGEVVDNGQPPSFMLNITNDSWYGESGGPYQHLEHAVYRAIEEGIPVIRVADTGFSALINPLGQIEARSELFREYEKKLALPRPDMLIREKDKVWPYVFWTILALSAFLGFQIRTTLLKV